ncbi:hypothetical protein [Sphingobium aquiterrae]|uniref:hypothetical protein n=1 Tax=Sphingobium aquiterrae TaxID=2038656 RepID=UPI0030174E72
MLSKIVFVAAPAAALLAAVPAIAGDAPKERFVHEGYTYIYQVKEEKGASRISGNRYPGGAAFSLVVRGGKVNGVSGGQQVAFDVDSARGAAAGAEVVAR